MSLDTIVEVINVLWRSSIVMDAKRRFNREVHPEWAALLDLWWIKNLRALLVADMYMNDQKDTICLPSLPEGPSSLQAPRHLP